MFSFLTRLFSSKSSAPAPTFDLDEQSLIMTVRTDMAYLANLAKMHHVNYSAQWRAYIADLNAPYVPGTFTTLEAQNADLQAAYEPVRCDIVRRMKKYDDYCADRTIAYSSAWNNLLAELRPHLSGISALGMKLAS